MFANVHIILVFESNIVECDVFAINIFECTYTRRFVRASCGMLALAYFLFIEKLIEEDVFHVCPLETLRCQFMFFLFVAFKFNLEENSRIDTNYLEITECHGTTKHVRRFIVRLTWAKWIQAVNKAIARMWRRRSFGANVRLFLGRDQTCIRYYCTNSPLFRRFEETQIFRLFAKFAAAQNKTEKCKFIAVQCSVALRYLFSYQIKLLFFITINYINSTAKLFVCVWAFFLFAT